MNTVGSSQRVPALPSSSAEPDSATSHAGVEPLADADDRTVISQRPPLPANGSGRATAPFELGKLLAGERLDHFELREYVGGGGMGAVFRALDTMLHREVALKVLSRDQGADEETRRRFQNEAQSAARLDHENIARVFYVGEDKGLNYIVFEFIEGVNLREFVEKRGPLPLAETISYTLQIADALAHAASRDVVHRDIKPSNVIITDDGRAKLVDMGLARLHQVQPDGEDLTASGVTLGTFDYISPEQARDPRSADVRSDIYSLGCSVYFMLTGRPPFPEGTVLQKLLQHNSDAPPDPRELNPDLPEELSAVVRKMLAKDPRRRYQHPGELSEDLYSLAEQIGLPAPGAGRTIWVPAKAPARLSTVERHLPWIIPVAALLAIVVFLDRWQIDEAPEAEAPRPAAEETGATAAKANAATVSTDRRETQTGSGPLESPDDPEEVDAGANAAKARLAASASSPVARDSSDAAAPMPKSGLQRAPSQPDQIGPDRLTAGTKKAPDLPAAGASGRSIAEPLAGASSANRTNLDPSRNSADGPVHPPGASKSGAAVAGKTAGGAPAKVPLEDLPPGVLVVGDAEGPQRYASLSAACAAAKSGDVIELRYDGPRRETPLALANLRLIIRGGEGFHPIVAFYPSDTDPYNFPHSMLRLAGGSLRLLNVALELQMPRGAPSENWSLIEAQLVESLSLEKCVLTAKNAADQGGAYHGKVSFFHVKAALGADSMMPKGMMSIPPIEIRLQDCLVRGEATLLRDDDAQAVQLKWNNGLLATSEWLLSTGGATTIPQTSGGMGGKVRLDLEHLTLVLGQGLCRMWNSYSAPGLLDVDLHCADSVLVAASEQATLVEQVCVEQAGDSERRLSWEGDRNLYSGFETFWKIGDAGSTSTPRRMTFEDWRAKWGGDREVRSNIAPIAWKRQPAAAQPLHQRTAADYAIDDRLENPAIYDTTDGELVGVNPAALPAWPLLDGRGAKELPAAAPAPKASAAPELD